MVKTLEWERVETIRKNERPGPPARWAVPTPDENLWRAAVPGGWLIKMIGMPVVVEAPDGPWEGGPRWASVAFYPDPEHKWE